MTRWHTCLTAMTLKSDKLGMGMVSLNGDIPKQNDQAEQNNQDFATDLGNLDFSHPELTDLALTDRFERRHIGLHTDDWQGMLEAIGCATVEDLITKTVPEKIRLSRLLNLPPARSEFQALQDLKAIANQNQVFRSYIGMGYYGCITPPVIQRNILENPGWYTQYTPYQAEIAQGRLEALLNFQTMVMDLTGMEIANASLLDEGTAAAEAMTMVYGIVTSDKRRQKEPPRKFFISHACHPQTIAVVQTRAIPLGIEVVLGDHTDPIVLAQLTSDYFGGLLQYPATDGAVYDDSEFMTKLHEIGGLVIVATDLLALTLLKPPGEFGADVVVGSAQRFGVPLGYGGPHAAFLATKEAYKRQIPGRVVGISKDVHGQPALRLALQTREQHIRRDKATSNICTAQVLLAVMASMYGVYHGATGLKQIAQRVYRLTQIVATGLRNWGYTVVHGTFFDTLKVILPVPDHQELLSKATAAQINLRIYPTADQGVSGNHPNFGAVGISLDEAVTGRDLQQLLQIFAPPQTGTTEINQLIQDLAQQIPQDLPLPAFCQRQTEFLTHPLFQIYHSETELLRYINRLQAKDLSLTTSMIPLGSCTMKLNATAEMLPVTWPEFGQIHPFAPHEQTKGYQMLFQQLETWLGEITGFAGVSLQPNAGSQGEYAGLLTIRNYHHARGETQRHVCLIPTSAHGTNPASAVMAGMTVVPVVCDPAGNIDVADLAAKAAKYQEHLAALMITYPSTHGVFEESIQDICAIVHQHGGQVYMDGANMNAQVGLCRPGDMGADVCHLNLHKTFCIPHGGGGPGMGPICVAAHLVPFLPADPLKPNRSQNHPQIPDLPVIAAAPWGSASILPISWMYIAMMGPAGLLKATQAAILNANYIAKKLEPYYPILYKGRYGLVAHECILDLRPYKASANIEVDDIAKRLMDYGFHAPTVSWPVAGTMMVEPTESESKAELDRFCAAMIAISGEISQIVDGKLDSVDNPLKNAPHTAASLLSDDWNHSYSRQLAAYPAPWLREHKFWATVGRIDNAYGDRNFVCSCLPMSAYEA